MSEKERALSTARKRRGVVRASITRLDTRVAELEDKSELSAEDKLSAQQLLQRVNALDVEFKTYHYTVVDLVDEGSEEGEQIVLDQNDDKIASLTVRIRRLISPVLTSTTPPIIAEPALARCLSRRLAHLGGEIQEIVRTIDSVAPDSDVDSCLLRQYEEQLANLKTELTAASREIVSLAEDEGDLIGEHARLSKAVFDVCLKIKRLLQGKPDKATFGSDKGGVRLPKLSVPMFDGNILHWRSFWEQFTVSVHSRSNLSPSEKLAYHKHSVKDGAAKNVVEGLSVSGDQYKEAVDCLCQRYDRPRLLHQAHVRAIVEAPSLKDGTGKELRRLHDVTNQHLRALKAMEYDPPGPFITSLLELKLDSGTMFEWRKHTQDASTVPHFNTLLEFLNLRAQASESTVPEKKRQFESSSLKRNFIPRPVTSLTADINKGGKHPLYSCHKFKSLPHDRMMSTLKTNGLCLNCLKPGHFVKECTSTHRCRKCQKLHHTLLHLEIPPDRPEPAETPPATSLLADSTSAHVVHAGSKPRQCLLMTCRVLVMSAGGLTTQARALLDSASSTSFISEHLDQHLRLPRHRRQAQITGISGLAHQSLGQSVVRFGVSPMSSTGERLEVEAIVLPKVTSELPVHPVPFSQTWHHLSGIALADPDFGVSGKVDILLGIDVFSDALLHSRRFGSAGSPTAFETRFGWVLAGAVDCGQRPSQVVSNHVAVLSTDDLLRRFWETEELQSSSHSINRSLSLDEKLVVEQFRKDHRRDDSGRFIVPLPRKTDTKPVV